MDVKKFVRDQGYAKDVPGGFYATVDLVEAAIAQDREFIRERLEIDLEVNDHVTYAEFPHVWKKLFGGE